MGGGPVSDLGVCVSVTVVGFEQVVLGRDCRFVARRLL